ncbi:hypothetical protein B5181_33675, partial [Streptomyces sp. 4F]
PAMLGIHQHSSSLTLPVRPPEKDGDTPAEPFGEPEGTPPIATTTITPPEERWDVKRDLVGYHSELETVKDRGTVRFEEIGLDVGRRAHERYASVADDFTSVSGESTWTMEFRRADWDV